MHAISCSFAVIYVYAGELMPTVVRSQAMGISSFVAGLGLLAFPYINSLVGGGQVSLGWVYSSAGSDQQDHPAAHHGHLLLPRRHHLPLPPRDPV